MANQQWDEKARLLAHARSLRGMFEKLSTSDTWAVAHAETLRTLEQLLKGDHLTDSGLEVVRQMVRDSQNQWEEQP